MTVRAVSELEEHELRVLVAAPTRRDGEVTQELFQRRGIDCLICNDLEEAAAAVDSGAGALVLTDAALGKPGMASLLASMQLQPPWSDLPTLLLTGDRLRSPTAVQAFQALGNVTLLERPSSTRSMISAVKSALRARRRQYQIRDQLIAQQHAEEALLNADRRKDEFLATLAHELRNPLAAIRTGLAVVARDPRDSARTDRVVGMIDRQSRLLVKLIDDLMDVSRIATGKVILQSDRLDLRSVLETGMEGGQTVFDSSRHHIRLDLPSEPVWIVGDASRLAQVVGNLVNNASKYTPDGGSITVELTQDADAAIIQVTDTGVGIPPEMLDQVFEMFTQVDRTLERARGGLGIGLSLVRRLVRLHDGTVTAHSAGIGQGSVFTVRLPLAGVAALSARSDSPPARGATSSLKVLVIDDNRDVADCLAALIEGHGHDIRTAYDGVTALAAARDFMPDLVFCDVGMPYMSGHELAGRLRADARRASMLLVAVTGWGNEQDKRRSIEAGFDLHFTKPISFEQVESILARF